MLNGVERELYHKSSNDLRMKNLKKKLCDHSRAGGQQMQKAQLLTI
ncbi:hypothetical protein H6S26_19155 [Escherichia coli]|nr:hypothetical protein H6S26_19155 [Escherichia coli]